MPPTRAGELPRVPGLERCGARPASTRGTPPPRTRGPHCPRGVPERSGWRSPRPWPDATFRTGLFRGPEAPLGEGPTVLRKSALPEHLPSKSSCHFCQTCFYFLECSQIDKLKHARKHTQRLSSPSENTQISKSQCSGF